MLSQTDRDLLYYGALRSLAGSGDGKLKLDLGEDSYVLFRRRACKVDEEWVICIEEAMPFVVKAVQEQRSLINKEGEIVRIDRAKHPSKESFRHLAQHSDLLGGDPIVDGKLVPEEIYITENTENFAVYENRFLYALLKLLHDFVSVRYNAIEKECSSETLKMKVVSSSRLGRTNGVWETDIEECGPSLNRYLPELPLAERLSNILDLVSSLLSGPLMQAVSMAPLLRPPIVRTNIIKNNVAFSACFDLYSFLMAYNKDGYSFEDEERKAKLSDDDIAMLTHIFGQQRLLMEMSAFGLKEKLNSDYEKQRAEARLSGSKRRASRMEELRSRLKTGEATEAEYISLLEEQLSEVNEESVEASMALIDANGRCDAMRSELDKAERRIESLGANVESLKGDVKAAYDSVEARLIKQRDEINEVMREREEKLVEKLSKADDEKAQALEEADRIWSEKHAAALAEKDEEIALLTARVKGQTLVEDPAYTENEYFSRETFIRLEAEYNAFKKYYNAEWKRAKKKIRSDIRRERREGDKGGDVNG